MEPTHNDLDLARAEGEGMNFVEPPPIPTQRRAVMTLRVQAQRLLGKLPPEQRQVLVVTAIAVSVGLIAKTLRMRHFTAMTLAAGAGVAVGLLLGQQPAALAPPSEVVP